MRNFNFQVRPYRAECVQWNGKNLMEMLALLDKANGISSVTLFREIHLVVRLSNGMRTLNHGDWALKGEDGECRFYTDEQFKIKYEKLEEVVTA